MKPFLPFAIAVALMCAAPAFAHTALQSSSPASGSVLAQSPPEVTLTFAEPVRLTALTAVSGANERRLTFSPAKRAKVFTAKTPQLPAGRTELRWTALSPDGHVVEGTIIVIVRLKP